MANIFNNDNNRSTLNSASQYLASNTQSVMDRIYPSERRANAQARFRSFTSCNPKLSAFILINILLTGPPLLLFTLYTLTVFLFSLSTVLITTFVLASLFTASMVGVALLILVPTMFVTTVTAMFLFGWGLLGYSVYEWSKRSDRGWRPQDQQQLQPQRGWNQHNLSLRAKGQKTKHYDYGSVSGHTEKGIKAGDDERRRKVNRDDALSDMKKPEEEDDEKEEKKGPEAERGDDDLNNEVTTPERGADDTFPQPVRTHSNTGQADYKATIADDGAYIEVAPGLNTVHSIAVGGG